MIVDRAIYVEGVRVPAPAPLSEMYEAVKAQSGIAWIGLYKPDAAEFDAVAREFGLHHLAVEDAVKAHQRPKLERFGDTSFIVLRPARYLDETESVEFSELHVFVGSDFVITVRHGESPDLGSVRRRMEASPALLRLGPAAILYAILDRVVDDYAPVVAGLENDIDEIETEVFGSDRGVTRRAYELSREVIEFQRAIRPLASMLGGLVAQIDTDGPRTQLQPYVRDVQDHVIRVEEQVTAFRELLQNILSVHLAIVTLQQNEDVRALTEASIAQNDEVKKISAWAAILFAPTLVGTVYGMNFRHMPELDWRLGYPFALVLMFSVSVVLYAIFRRVGWLT